MYIKRFGTIRIWQPAMMACLLWVAGCTKETGEPVPANDTAELSFMVSVLSEPQVWDRAGSPSGNMSKAYAVNTENLPPDAEVFVRVYPAEGGRPDYSSPVAEGVYRISDPAAGTAVPLSADDKITMRTGRYAIDFTYPASTPGAQGSIAVANGTDFMARTVVTDVTPDAAGRFAMDVRLARLCSRLGIRITPKAGTSVSEIKECSLSGLVREAAYVPGSGTLTVTGTGRTIEVDPTTFDMDGGKPYVGNILVLPLAGNAHELTCRVVLVTDGREATVSAVIPGVELNAGCERLLDLSVVD